MIVRIRDFALAVLAIAASCGVASATTVGFTEGSRPLVLGTTDVTPPGDASKKPPGPSLGTLSVGNEIDLYGRIVGSVDYFNITATTNFTVSFILTGYTEVKKNGKQDFVADSGFVADGKNKSNESEFRLTVATPGGPTFTPVDFITPVTSAAGYTAVTALIFSAGPGTYYFSVDGGAKGGPSDGARYDLSFAAAPFSAAATPLPASLPIFATGLGLGAGVLRWRKRKRAAA
jgi:hypothetical protein